MDKNAAYTAIHLATHRAAARVLDYGDLDPETRTILQAAMQRNIKDDLTLAVMNAIVQDALTKELLVKEEATA